jgi:glycosyltransferase involved in cell wall biosynthesis
MRIVIDMQGAQIESLFRGIGRYSMAFAEAVVRNAGEHDIILALSGLFPETIEPIRAAFEGVLPQDKIRVWYAPGPVKEESPDNDSRREVAELLREAFLASLQPDVIHVSSLFVGFAEDAVTSVGRFDTTTPTSVMLHGDDLIAESDTGTQPSSEYERFHTKKLSQLKSCSLCMIVSGSLDRRAEACVDNINNIVIRLSLDTNPVSEPNAQHQRGSKDYWGWAAYEEASQKAIQAWEQLVEDQKGSEVFDSTVKPRMAYVSPLPPEQTGIADYSAELLPALAEYYDIIVITAEKGIDTSRINKRIFAIKSIDWLRDHVSEIDRVLYHVGNSSFHGHMLPLIREIPGTVVLHDFYLGDLMYWLETKAGLDGVWTRALYQDHGYMALKSGYQDLHASVKDYPVNFDFLKQAKGIISHSDYSKELSRSWYGESIAKDWNVIPHLRSTAERSVDKKKEAKKQLGFSEDDLVVCCFGVLGPLKLNKCLLDSWLDTDLANEDNSYLVFVGQDNESEYEKELKNLINKHGLQKQIWIMGFAPYQRFHQYLDACDLAVQLRTHSRGETSGTVLDCMNHGVPTIVNANGSMGELDQESVWMLPDDFSQEQLKHALMTLAHDKPMRKAITDRAREVIIDQHSPEKCAALYYDAIERFYAEKWEITGPLIQAIALEKIGTASDEVSLIEVSESIARTLPDKKPCRTLFVDISATCRNDLGTGIERTARALVLALLKVCGTGIRIEPVYLDLVNGRWRHRLAKLFTLSLIGCPLDAGDDEIIAPQPGDIVVGLDLCGVELVQAQKEGLFDDYRDSGIPVYFMIHDLLPIRMPELFPPRAGEVHEEWLHSLSTFDGIVGVTENVAQDYSRWLQEKGVEYQGRRPFVIRSSHHGADFRNSAPTHGLTDDAEEKLASIAARQSFLMVGTIEPRKGYLDAVNAFSALWELGLEANLVIVGSEGWKDLPEKHRRDIPETIQRLRNHPEAGVRLFWLEGISDEYLEKVYTASSCLIAASYGEGFGLPLIEAAQHQKPIIARDIPVFREVAGNYAFYFDKDDPEGLSAAIRSWLELSQKGKHPRPDEMPWLTWEQSAQNLLRIVLDRNRADVCRQVVMGATH